MTLLLLLGAVARAEVNLPEANPIDPIVVSAEAANRWQQGTSEVWLLRGNCRIGQGRDVVQCQEAVLWIERTAAANGERSTVIAYLEGDVRLDLHRGGVPTRLASPKWFGRFSTIRTVQVQAGVVAGRPDVLPEIYQRGMEARNPAFSDALRHAQVEQAQFVVPRNELPPPGQPSPAAGPAPAGKQPLPPGTRRIQVNARGDVPMQFEWRNNPQTNQWTAVIDQGVIIRIDGVTVNGGARFGALSNGPMTIDISTDRLVIWTTAQQQPNLQSGAAHDANQPWEIYMEGNIVFREGDQTIYADRMYYDVRNHVGTVLAADMLSRAPGYEGLVRMHAEVLQQTGPGQFIGSNAFFTSSRLGIPRYSLRSGEITFNDIQTPKLDPLTGQQLNKPGTEEPEFDHEQLLTASNDLLYIEDVPIFYWPYIATDLNDSSFFLRRVQYKDDGVFGNQFLTDFNAYQLLGIKHRPAGTDWNLSLDYYSLRGFAAGTTYTYHRDEFFGIPGQTSGLFDFWGIHDKGTDNLGVDRPSVIPDETLRYRLLFEHRQKLSDEWQVTIEAGKISDRNFLEEYFKQEWDELKNQSTDAELKWRYADMSASLFASIRTDDFFTETQWLPRGDAYLLGQSLADDHLTWMSHSSAGYAQLRTSTLPNPATGDVAVSHLPWEPENLQGGRLVTRNEFDLPLQAGPVKVVPYVLGELGYWGEDLNGDQLTRAYYQAGVRATLPVWAVDANVESELWNVHGLAHKIEFEAEYLHAQASRHIDQFPLYDPLDDDQIEDFRRRLVVETFGLPVVPPPGTQGPPTKFDERYYALRTDLQGWVTSPSMEIADNLDEVQLGIHQRWQTKRGPEDNRHIIDWIEFDTNATFFPNANRDNFGDFLGLLNYDFTWHVGDRLTLLSDGIFDVFGEGQKIVSVGAFLNRPPRGAVYLGFRLLEGPIDSKIVTASYSYWMSPKWVSSVGLTMDLTDVKNIGEFVRITRVGESLLVSADFTADPARNTVGVNFSVEPRFISKGKVNQTSGVHVPTAGAYGLE